MLNYCTLLTTLLISFFYVSPVFSADLLHGSILEMMNGKCEIRYINPYGGSNKLQRIEDYGLCTNLLARNPDFFSREKVSSLSITLQRADDNKAEEICRFANNRSAVKIDYLRTSYDCVPATKAFSTIVFAHASECAEMKLPDWETMEVVCSPYTITVRDSKNNIIFNLSGDSKKEVRNKFREFILEINPKLVVWSQFHPFTGRELPDIGEAGRLVKFWSEKDDVPEWMMHNHPKDSELLILFPIEKN